MKVFISTSKYSEVKAWLIENISPINWRNGRTNVGTNSYAGWGWYMDSVLFPSQGDFYAEVDFRYLKPAQRTEFRLRYL